MTAMPTYSPDLQQALQDSLARNDSFLKYRYLLLSMECECGYEIWGTNRDIDAFLAPASRHIASHPEEYIHNRLTTQPISRNQWEETSAFVAISKALGTAIEKQR